MVKLMVKLMVKSQVRDMENILGRDKEMDLVREELEAYLASWQVIYIYITTHIYDIYMTYMYVYV